MGERVIKPSQNVFNKYKDVNLVNPNWFVKPFQSNWRTSNTSAGSSTSTQIKLPLISTGSYNFVVDWGDGSHDTITVWNQAQTTHTYSAAGDYTLKITGTCVGWQFNNTGDRLKILSISSWGKFKLGTNQAAFFFGCSNLNLASVSDVLDLTGTTTLSQAFQGCGITTINRVNEWNTSSVTSMVSTFANTSFNQNIGSWNVSNVTSFTNMFQTSVFNNGGSNTINNWVTTSANQMQAMFSQNSVFNQPIGSWNTANVTNFSLMFQNAIAFNQNIGNWNVAKGTNFANMFVGATAFNNGGSNTINNWVFSNISAIAMNSMFSGAANFNQTLGNWNTGLVTTMNSMFSGASTFNQNIGSWNVSNVTSFQNMFQSTNAFNNGGSATIDNWVLKTSGVTVTSMFQSALAFNQPVGSWNMIGVTSLSSMFNNAQAFNNGGSSNINNWNVSNVTTMASAFIAAISFNQPIGSWNTANVTSVNQMFSSASSFNQNIGSWNVGNLVTMTSMFQFATAFNNGGSTSINSWNTVKVNNMQAVFRASAFNQPIGSWNTAAVLSFGNFSSGGMFMGNTAFNQDISAWNVSTATSTGFMFNGATAFNNGGSALINNWVTSAVTTMESMFSGATAFNQNIGSWNVSNVTIFTNFMLSKTAANYSTANLDSIYNNTTGWASRSVKPSINITFGSIKYTSAGSAGKAILTGAPNNWVITDGGI